MRYVIFRFLKFTCNFLQTFETSVNIIQDKTLLKSTKVMTADNFQDMVPSIISTSNVSVMLYNQV